MKSRTHIVIALLAMAPAVTASAQVFPLGKAPTRGRVEPASCSSCTSCGGSHGGFYDGAVWGTSCMDCNVHPGLFPPCPNPCQTTLLGELCHDLKVAVDNGLSHLFCCLAGDTGFGCGCYDVCSCGDASCGMATSDCGCGGATTIETMMPSTAIPAEPQMSPQPDPFRDDPPAAQPTPAKTTRRSLLPGPKASIASTRRPSRIQRVAHSRPVSRSRSAAPPTIASMGVSAQPIVDVEPIAPEHYHPRRGTSLRRANGKELKMTPLRGSNVQPSLRFREVQ